MSGVQRRAQDWNYKFKNHEYIGSICETEGSRWELENKCDREGYLKAEP